MDPIPMVALMAIVDSMLMVDNVAIHIGTLSFCIEQ